MPKPVVAVLSRALVIIAVSLSWIVMQSTGAAANEGSQNSGDLAEAAKDFQTALANWGDGTSAEAERLLNRALSIREFLLGPTHPAVAEIVERLGAIEYNRHHFPAAEVRFRRSLDIDSNALGERNLSTALALGDLGAALREQYRFGEAEPLVRRSLAVRRELLAVNDPSIAASLHNLGLILFGERRYSDARTAVEEELQIDRASPIVDDRRVKRGEDLLGNIGAAETKAGRLVRLVWRATCAMGLCIAFLASVVLWREQKLRFESSNIELPHPQFGRTVAIASTIAMIALVSSAAVIGSIGCRAALAAAAPQHFSDSESLRAIGKLGGILGIWLAIIFMQAATNAGRLMLGLPVQPITFIRKVAAHGAPSNPSVAADADWPLVRQSGDAAPWFAAMTYYAIILNRTFKVFVSNDLLCGAVVRGVVANPAFPNAQMADQTYWVTTRMAREYDGVDLSSTTFLNMNSANFQISWSELRNVDFRPGKKWGMGGVPHSGRLILHTRTGARRELILLGRQDGEALMRLIAGRMEGTPNLADNPG